MTAERSLRNGMLLGLVAYGIWGLMPLYFHGTKPVGPDEMLAQRIVWSLVAISLLLTVVGRWGELFAALRTRKTFLMLALSAALVAINWYGYIFAVHTGRTVEASLGYFLLPLANVGFGMFIFKEKLRTAQGIALSIAAMGLAVMIAAYGAVPWIGLLLTLTFGSYGVMRKLVPVDGAIGLAVEAIVLAPIAFGYLCWLHSKGELAFPSQPLDKQLWVAFSGIITTIPLICFAQAVRRVGLINIGFIQYISPTIQLLVAVMVLGEEFSTTRFIAFGFVWAGLSIFVWDTIRSLRSRKAPTACEANEMD